MQEKNAPIPETLLTMIWPISTTYLCNVCVMLQNCQSYIPKLTSETSLVVDFPCTISPKRTTSLFTVYAFNCF